MSGSRDEYHWLRRHMHGQFTLVIQVFTTSVVAAVALAGYVFTVLIRADVTSSTTPFLFLTPLAISIPCAYLIGSLRKEIFKWGMYIKVYLEDGNDLKYETELDKYRKRFPERESFNPIAITYWALLLICSLLFGYALHQVGVSLLWLIILVIPLIFLLHWYRDYKDIPYRCSEEYNVKWEEIRRTCNGVQQVQQSKNCDELHQKLDRLDTKMNAILKDNKTFKKQQSIFAAALSGLALAVTLVIFGYQSAKVYVVFTGVALWCFSLACFIYLAVKSRSS
jgi:ABC-type multidrug transport system fused ATPase/permease subunit